MLRRRQASHYRYQASPDADGKWYNEMQDRPGADGLRNKYPWSAYFEDIVEDILKNRPLPFLVDVGGKPTPDQQALFSLATHAIILGGNEEELELWRTIVTRQGLTIIVEVLSSQTEADCIRSEQVPLQVTLSGLERGRIFDAAASPVWQALAERTHAALSFSDDDVWNYHWGKLDCNRFPFHAAKWLFQLPSQKNLWEFSDLALLRTALDPTMPLALFADFPVWVAPAIALHCNTPPICFDARLGWIEIPILHATDDPERSPWSVNIREAVDHFSLDIRLRYTHLSHTPDIGAMLPTPPSHKPLIVNGQLPRWLFVALTLYYAERGYTIGIGIPKEKRAVLLNGAYRDNPITWTPPPPSKSA